MQQSKNMNKLFILVPLITVAVFIFAPKSKPKTTQIGMNNPVQTVNSDTEKKGFSGEKGQVVTLENNQLTIATADFEVNKVKFFNTTLADGKTVYFLVLKDKDGNFRAAANANKQCASFGKGYRQVGDEIECLTCNKKYPLTDFAVAQPDCNPYPINAKLPTKDGQIVINSTELENVASLF
jgi:uncharacterized membrane protein